MDEHWPRQSVSWPSNRPDVGSLHRRNAARAPSTRSMAERSQDAGAQRRPSSTVDPLIIDKARRLSPPAHADRSASDPGISLDSLCSSSPGTVSVGSNAWPASEHSRPGLPHRPRSASAATRYLSLGSSASTAGPIVGRCPSPHDAPWTPSAPSGPLPRHGYTDSDFVPLPVPNGTARETTLHSPPSTSLGLAIPLPTLAIEAATPVTPVRPHRESYDAALVEAQRDRMSAAFLAQRKERRRSWTNGDRVDASQVLGAIGTALTGRGRNRSESRHRDKEQVVPLEEWERELRDLDAEQKMWSLDEARRRSQEYKDWERQQRSEAIRHSLVSRRSPSPSFR